QLGLIACRKSQIKVPAENNGAILSGEAGKGFPNRLRPKRKRKFLGRAPLQAQIAEVDTACSRASAALVDHNDRATASAQEIGRVAAHQPATNNRHVGRYGGHSASPRS